jgi:hypothetical protein
MDQNINKFMGIITLPKPPILYVEIMGEEYFCGKVKKNSKTFHIYKVEGSFFMSEHRGLLEFSDENESYNLYYDENNKLFYLND